MATVTSPEEISLASFSLSETYLICQRILKMMFRCNIDLFCAYTRKASRAVRQHIVSLQKVWLCRGKGQRLKQPREVANRISTVLVIDGRSCGQLYLFLSCSSSQESRGCCFWSSISHCPSLPGGITDIANFPANVETAGGALAPRDFFVGTLVVA